MKPIKKDNQITNMLKLIVGYITVMSFSLFALYNNFWRSSTVVTLVLSANMFIIFITAVITYKMLFTS